MRAYAVAQANADESELRSELVESGDLQEIVEDINSEINLLEPVRITFWSAPADKPPAMYDTDFNQILISYGFVAELSGMFGGDFDGWRLGRPILSCGTNWTRTSTGRNW